MTERKMQPLYENSKHQITRMIWFCSLKEQNQWKHPRVLQQEAALLTAFGSSGSESERLSAAGVHGAAGLPVARAGQRGDQRDEGAARTQREHAEEHPPQPRGPTLSGEGPGQRGLHEAHSHVLIVPECVCVCGGVLI